MFRIGLKFSPSQFFISLKNICFTLKQSLTSILQIYSPTIIQLPRTFYFALEYSIVSIQWRATFTRGAWGVSQPLARWRCSRRTSAIQPTYAPANLAPRNRVDIFRTELSSGQVHNLRASDRRSRLLLRVRDIGFGLRWRRKIIPACLIKAAPTVLRNSITRFVPRTRVITA